jgi:hypothetical protein
VVPRIGTDAEAAWAVRVATGDDREDLFVTTRRSKTHHTKNNGPGLAGGLGLRPGRLLFGEERLRL